jgi:hypothetical protein
VGTERRWDVKDTVHVGAGCLPLPQNARGEGSFENNEHRLGDHSRRDDINTAAFILVELSVKLNILHDYGRNVSDKLMPVFSDFSLLYAGCS